MAIHDYGRPEPPEGVRLWDTEQFRKDFKAEGFRAPLVRVVRLADGAKGWMEFTHWPRYYFNFVPDDDG